MLKNVPQILSPELLKTLSEMGHGDRILLTDANYPAESMGRDCKVIRCDGLRVTEVLDAVLRLIPLDAAVEKPVSVMAVPADDPVETPVWDEYKKIVSKYDERGGKTFQEIERFKFYEESKKAYAIVYCSEYQLYANIMLQKGCLKPEDYVPVYVRE